MTVHNISEEVKEDLEAILQDNFRKFCVGKLAGLKIRYNEKHKQLEKLQEEVNNLEKELQTFTTEKYKDEYYNENREMYMVQDSRSPYIRDLEIVLNTNKK